jgi:hypothetical protein
VGREWRLVVECHDARKIERALEAADPEFDLERLDDVLYVYGDLPHRPRTMRRRFLAELERCGLEGTIAESIPVEWWNGHRHLYVSSGRRAWTMGDWEHAEVRPDEVTWAVEVVGADVWHHEEAFRDLVERGRPPVGRTKRGWEVGALDETDAEELVAELLARSDVRSARARPLGWFGRWLVRERLLGNYAGEGDPTQP